MTDITLAAGRKYRGGDGAQVVLELNEEPLTKHLYKFVGVSGGGARYHYAEDGAFFADGRTSPYDLVEEVKT